MSIVYITPTYHIKDVIYIIVIMTAESWPICNNSKTLNNYYSGTTKQWHGGVQAWGGKRLEFKIFSKSYHIKDVIVIMTAESKPICNNSKTLNNHYSDTIKQWVWLIFYLLKMSEL